MLENWHCVMTLVRAAEGRKQTMSVEKATKMSPFFLKQSKKQSSKKARRRKKQEKAQEATDDDSCELSTKLRLSKIIIAISIISIWLVLKTILYAS